MNHYNVFERNPLVQSPFLNWIKLRVITYQVVLPDCFGPHFHPPLI